MSRRLLLVPLAVSLVVAALLWLETPGGRPPDRPAHDPPGRADPLPADEPAPLSPPPLGDAFVAGRVLDAAGHPVPGARVAAEVLTGAAAVLRSIGVEDDFETSRLEALAGTDGTFRIGGLPPGVLTVSAEAEGGLEGRVETSAPAKSLTIRLDATGAVSAVVAAEGAETVYLVLLPGHHRAEGPPGEFTIRGLPPGHYLLDVSCEGFRPFRSAALEVTGGRTTETPAIRLVPGTLVRGTVRTPDGRPLSGASVFFERVESSGLVHHTTWYGDIPVAEDGTFSRRVPPGRWRIRAECPGHGPAGDGEGRADLRVGEEPVALDFVLAPRPDEPEPEEDEPTRLTLTGRIVDEAGRPLPRAAVRRGPDHAIAGPGGTFRLECLDIPADLVYAAPGFLPAVLRELKIGDGPGPHSLGDLRLDRRGGVTVGGLVTDDRGSPLAGARVEARFRTPLSFVHLAEARTGADGRYRIPGPRLDEGEVSVRARVPGYEGCGATVPVAPAATADLVLRPIAAVTGVVEFPAEVPGNVVIEIEYEDGGSTQYVDWNPATRRWRNTLEPGRYLLWVGAVGCAPRRAGWFEARAGETVEAPVAKLTRGGTVEGMVRNRDGTPAGGRQISIRYRTSEVGDRAVSRILQQTTGKDGSFRFENVPPGVYPITAATRGATVREKVSVAEGATTWRELRPTE